MNQGNSDLYTVYPEGLNFILKNIFREQNKVLQTGPGNQAKGQANGLVFCPGDTGLIALPGTSWYLSRVYRRGWGNEETQPQESLAPAVRPV